MLSQIPTWDRIYNATYPDKFERKVTNSTTRQCYQPLNSGRKTNVNVENSEAAAFTDQ